VEEPVTDVLLDTHCHLDLSQILMAATTAGVQVVAVTNTPDRTDDAPDDPLADAVDAPRGRADQTVCGSSIGGDNIQIGSARDVDIHRGV
jgi:hypothetical protein